MSSREGLALATLVALAATATACGDDQAANPPEPSGLSIAPSSASPSSPRPSSPRPSTSRAAPPKPTTTPSIAQTERVTTALDAVGVAESAVADSAAVEVSKDDGDNQQVWEITVRAGDNGRELRISARDGSVLSNRSAQLDRSQLGATPQVDVRKAVDVAGRAVDNGVVTEAELSSEDGKRVWDLSVTSDGGTEWEIWVDASSGAVVRRERD